MLVKFHIFFNSAQENGSWLLVYHVSSGVHICRIVRSTITHECESLNVKDLRSRKPKQNIHGKKKTFPARITVSALLYSAVYACLRILPDLSFSLLPCP
jgi:hypothetical protein